MNQPLTIEQALASVPVMAAVIFLTRVFPFALFSRREPPAFLRFAAKYLPPMVMAVLIVYCLRAVSFTSFPYGLAEAAGIAVTAAAHLWKGNAMISIFGGTAVYMILSSL